MCAATADSPSAAISVGTAPSGSGTRSADGTAAASAMLPSPGAIPADIGNHTACPSTVPTPCTPGTYGVRGTPKYDVPEAHSRSSGTIGAAVTPHQHLARAGLGLGPVDDRGWLARRVQLDAPCIRSAAARSRRSPKPTARSLVPPSGVGPGSWCS